MSDRVYGTDEKGKLERIVQEGVTVLQEVEDLQAGLKDTVKAIAEEMDLKPGIINKAIKIAHKASFQDEYDKFDELETILETVGRTL